MDADTAAQFTRARLPSTFWGAIALEHALPWKSMLQLEEQLAG